jgi:hypothetical protein
MEALDIATLARVKSKKSKLDVSELPAWNDACERELTLGLMRRGVLALRSFVSAAEP